MDNDFYNSKCPNCGLINKTIKIDTEGHYYVVCSACDYQTPHFKFVLQAQANWIVGGHNGFPVSM